MSVKIYCQCGADVTHAVSLWDRKTRSVFWMEEHPLLCALCAARTGRGAGGAQPATCTAGPHGCRAQRLVSGSQTAPAPWRRDRRGAKGRFS